MAEVIRGVRPIGFISGDPGMERVDVSVSAEGTIASVEPSRGGSEKRGIDAQGCLMSPGWVDLHTHVYEAAAAGIDPERIGPRHGVAEVVDVGSAGEATFAGFRRYVLEQSTFPVVSFLNIGSSGIEPYTPEAINPARTAQCVEANRAYIRGIKALGSKKYIGSNWVHPVAAAKRLAVDLGLPVMVHVAEPPVYLEELVDILGEGDVITHCFHGKVGNSVRSSPSRVLPLYHRAHDKGILLDVGHGAASFSVEAASAAIAAGVKPDVVSTDLHSGNIDGPVWSLALTASKMLACGLALEEVIPSITTAPAEVIGESEYGSLEVGAPACFTVFDLESGSYEFLDTGAPDDATSGSDPSCQLTFAGEGLLRPRWCVLGAEVTACEEMGGVNPG